MSPFCLLFSQAVIDSNIPATECQIHTTEHMTIYYLLFHLAAARAKESVQHTGIKHGAAGSRRICSWRCSSVKRMATSEQVGSRVEGAQFGAGREERCSCNRDVANSRAVAASDRRCAELSAAPSCTDRVTRVCTTTSSDSCHALVVPDSENDIPPSSLFVQWAVIALIASKC